MHMGHSVTIIGRFNLRAQFGDFIPQSGVVVGGWNAHSNDVPKLKTFRATRTKKVPCVETIEI